jgi:hypothetical protein
VQHSVRNVGQAEANTGMRLIHNLPCEVSTNETAAILTSAVDVDPLRLHVIARRGGDFQTASHGPVLSRPLAPRERRQRQESSSQGRDTGAAVHLPAQHLESVDMAFDRSIAPRLSHGAFHGTEILP